MSKPNLKSDLPPLASPAQRALQSAGIQSLLQLAQLSETEAAQLHGLGPSALARLRQALAQRGWSFRVDKEPSMNHTVRRHLNHIFGEDRAAQNASYQALMKMTERPVTWAYDIWDELLAGLTHKDNHTRAVAAQVLANLAQSDPHERMLEDFNRLLAVTKDERFVTARHCLQSIWRVGLGGRKHQRRVVQGLEQRFLECATEKNGTLTRYDILIGLRQLYAAVSDEAIKATALALIEMETEAKYRRKYAGVWKKA